ncbi:Cyclin N-terminal domain-containing protein 1 [Lamellibrachia satsuma]|nr:Cyclin N-terminal domain-containing protein 1 [Lamellibrachia satsuma]
MASAIGKKDSGIFGTPPEPFFNMKPIGMSADLLEEWLIVLANENQQNMSSATHKQGYFKNGDSAEFVFLTCERLKLPPETRYLALELFDRFMVRHIQDLYVHVQNMSSKNRKQDWLVVMDRVRNQVLLRAVSCCQLASKLTSHYKVVTARKAWNTLNEFGHRYTNDSILQSELRVLKTLDYKVMLPSPLLYIETLLEILGHNDSSAEVKMYHGVCLKVLDVVYMWRRDIYKKLFQLATGRFETSTKERAKFATVEQDYMLLAVAVIASTSYILNQTLTHRVIKNLSQITRIPNDDILDFATVIVQMIVEGSEQ